MAISSELRVNYSGTRGRAEPPREPHSLTLSFPSQAALSAWPKAVFATRYGYAGFRHLQVDPCRPLESAASCRGPFAPFFNRSEGRHPSWLKPLALRYLFTEYDVVLMTDTDVVPCRMDISLDEIIAELLRTGRGFATGPHASFGGVNTGVLLMRRTPLMLEMLDEWWAMAGPGAPMRKYAFSGLWEQGAMNDLRGGLLSQKRYATSLVETDLLATNVDDIGNHSDASYSHPCAGSRKEFHSNAAAAFSALANRALAKGSSISDVDPNWRHRAYYGHACVWRHLSTGRVKKRLREIAASGNHRGNHRGNHSGNDGSVHKPEPLKAAWLLGDAAARAFTRSSLVMEELVGAMAHLDIVRVVSGSGGAAPQDEQSRAE